MKYLNNSDMLLNKKNIKYLVVHCSDTSNEIDLNAEDIHKMHLKFGWNGIGYQKVICRNGTVECGRPEYWQGAHVYGYNNVSIGVCLIGKSEFSPLQYISLKKVLLEWKTKYPQAIILGHRDLGKTRKTCPNFDVQSWCKQENL